MRTTTQETATLFSRGTPLFNRCNTTKPASLYCRVLIDQVCIFRATAFAKVPDLHHFGQHGHIDRRLGSFGIIVLFENIVVLAKCEHRQAG